jgi:hypothetical protein
VFSEHYRQPVSELSVIAYAEDLADLTAEQLDAACVEARRTSQFLPVSATIRAAHEKMRTTGNLFLGPRMLSYTETPLTLAEREECIRESQKLKLALTRETQAARRDSPKPSYPESPAMSAGEAAAFISKFTGKRGAA